MNFVLNSKGPVEKFVEGLVFGFDLGTASIGYAVREGSKFLDSSAVICPQEATDLKTRRTLRRQRRTLRGKKFRRSWFANELDKLGIQKPATPQHDPISLRLRAVAGESLDPGELHAALAHLFKRRGYAEVPWANRLQDKDQAKEEGVVKEKVKELRGRLEESLPCQLLDLRRRQAGKSPTESWARNTYWPRECLEREFQAIVAAQSKRHPQLAEKADWLLYGDTVSKARNGKVYRVYFKATEGRNPGILGLRWPRFDNRGPSLDAFQPVDAQGRPRHVLKREKQAYKTAQLALALMNFRVMDAATMQKLDPTLHFPEFIADLRAEWNKKEKITKAQLKKLAKPFSGQFLLLEDQPALTPDDKPGRGRYSTPSLNRIVADIEANRRVDPPQPVLRRKNESLESALNRYISEIKHPLVKHRLVLFRRLLAKLVAKFGKPDLIVVEAVRTLAMGNKAKTAHLQRVEAARAARESARDELSAKSKATSRKAIQRFRLWKEAGSHCPFCLQPIPFADLGTSADIEHIVPKSMVDSNDFANLTVAHLRCNREVKRDRTPHQAFHATEQWTDIVDFATKHFSGRKLELFLNPQAEKLLEDQSDLQQTAYIARVIRHVALLQLGWLGQDGRDPSPERQNSALRFQVTNGQLTSRLRNAWGLNRLLHPLPEGQSWDQLSEEERAQWAEKNRGDLRHHALDAMVIACTLPWLAHRTHGATDEFGNHGWWTQDEDRRSNAANPVFGNSRLMREAVRQQIDTMVVQHHVSKSNHQKGYATTFYSKKAKDTYVARENFTDLTPKNLRDIWPREFANYCAAAWHRYGGEAADLKAELKATGGKLPEAFTSRLCFSSFQAWRAGVQTEFEWPAQVKIPIRAVRLVSIKDDLAVAPSSPGTKAFVKRTGYKEVRVHLAADHSAFVPVFIPYFQKDRPRHSAAELLPHPVLALRRGNLLKTVRPFRSGQPAGLYRVLVTGQDQIKLLPTHIASNEEAALSFGLPKSFLQVRWDDLMHALGHELPHPPSP